MTKIYVVTAVGETLSVNLEDGETWADIRDVKEKLQSEHGIAVQDHQLVYNGRVLPPFVMLSDAMFSRVDPLCFSLCRREAFHIFVQAGAKTIMLEVDGTDRILKVRALVDRKLGERSVRKQYVHLGKVLSEGATLSALGIKDKARLKLVDVPAKSSRDMVSVKVRNNAGHEWRMTIKPRMQTRRFKTFVGEKIGLEDGGFTLACDGTGLSYWPEDTFESLGIEDGDVLDVMPILRGGAAVQVLSVRCAPSVCPCRVSDCVARLRQSLQ